MSMVNIKGFIFILYTGFICNISASDKKISSLQEHHPKSLLTESIKKYLANKKNDFYDDEPSVFLEKQDNTETSKKNRNMFKRLSAR